MKRIAGHDFENGRCTSCGRLWLDIRHVDRDYVDLFGYAHSGALTESEVSQIVEERQREEAACAEALAELSH